MKSPLGRLDVKVGPHFQDKLAALVRAEKPKLMIETGLETGFGAEYYLKAMDDNGFGTLISIDPWPHKEYLANPINHPKFVFVQKKSEDCLPEIYRRYGDFDIFLHDSDHSYTCQSLEYEWAWKFVRSGGIIASDDVYWEIPPHHAWEKFLKRHEMLGKAVVIGNAQYIRRP